MTQTGALKYDPFQATAICRIPSSTGEASKEKADIRQETVRPYQDLYWYPSDAANAHIHNLSSPSVVSTATAFVEPSTIVGSMSVQGNNVLAIKAQKVTPRVLFRKSVYAQAQSRFEVLQKWEGIVLDVLTDSFTARLIDLTRAGADEEAEFALDEIDGGDRDLLKPGAVFYWNIGYSDSPTGRARVSIIRFRRLPLWRSGELELRD